MREQILLHRQTDFYATNEKLWNTMMSLYKIINDHIKHFAICMHYKL